MIPITGWTPGDHAVIGGMGGLNCEDLQLETETYEEMWRR